MALLDGSGLSVVWAKAKEVFAPILHSSQSTEYGVGSNNLYGHVKLSDSITDSTNTASNGGVAATPYAVKSAIDNCVTWRVF